MKNKQLLPLVGFAGLLFLNGFQVKAGESHLMDRLLGRWAIESAAAENNVSLDELAGVPVSVEKPTRKMSWEVKEGRSFNAINELLAYVNERGTTNRNGSISYQFNGSDRKKYFVQITPGDFGKGSASVLELNVNDGQSSYGFVDSGLDGFTRHVSFSDRCYGLPSNCYLDYSATTPEGIKEEQKARFNVESFYMLALEDCINAIKSNK